MLFSARRFSSTFRPKVHRIDHLVVTVSNMQRSCKWYETMLGMRVEKFRSPSAPETERFALTFGNQKINLHQHGATVVPMAKAPGCGTADFCLVTDQPVEDFKKHWEAHKQTIVERDVVKRTGAQGPIRSIYTYDPDGHLIEVSNYSKD